MEELARRKRNIDRLNECWVTFGGKVNRLIKALENQGYRPRIQDAWRSPAAQQRAFESGHSKLRWGFHNATSVDGKPEALAVDLLDDDNPINPPTIYLLALAWNSKRLGLETGIAWGLPDPLKRLVAERIDLYPMEPNAATKIGWDPTHVQPLGLSVEDAKAGKRI